MRRAVVTSVALLLAASPRTARAVPQGTGGEIAVTTLPSELRRGRDLLQQRRFAEARALFTAYLRSHPGAVQAEMGLGDAQLGQRQLEAAETTYRQVVATQPELWQAHKDLVVVEAGLGRWEEFDRERTVLRMARERGAPGISARESDLVDSFHAAGRHWMVRAYFEPVGRSEALYNFESFSPEGRVETVLSLESQVAARVALAPGDVRIGAVPSAGVGAATALPLALNWYTGAAHGTIRSYASAVPTYEKLRADVIHWLQQRHETAKNGAAERPDAHRTSEAMAGRNGRP